MFSFNKIISRVMSFSPRSDFRMWIIAFLTQLGRDKMDAISQTTFSCAFSSMKIAVFWLNFHWNMFARVQLTIIQHRLRWWLGADQATSQPLSQPMTVSLPTHIFVNRTQLVKYVFSRFFIPLAYTGRKKDYVFASCAPWCQMEVVTAGTYVCKQQQTGGSQRKKWEGRPF